MEHDRQQMAALERLKPNYPPPPDENTVYAYRMETTEHRSDFEKRDVERRHPETKVSHTLYFLMTGLLHDLHEMLC